MNVSQICALATKLRIRERTVELCTVMGIDRLSHREEYTALKPTMLDTGIEGRP